MYNCSYMHFWSQKKINKRRNTCTIAHMCISRPGVPVNVWLGVVDGWNVWVGVVGGRNRLPGVWNTCLGVPKRVAGVQRRTKNKKEEKTPANTHITRVPGCKDKNNINKPPKHAYACPGGAKKENEEKKAPKHAYACPGGAKKENEEKKAPETRYAVFLVQEKKRK